MASRPLFPQPANVFTRISNALGFGPRGEIPQAQPGEENPIKAASPEEPDAQPPVQKTYTRAFGGFSIDARWLSQLALNDDSILQREGQHDLKLYDAVLDDDVAASAFQQRRLAVVSKPWEVESGDDSALAKQAADHLREQIAKLGWDHICDKMLYGRWYGYAVAEALYDIGADGKIWLQDILVPDRKWFGFTNSGELRLKTADAPQGEALPPNKFWAFRTGASHDFAPYGVGLAHWCYWPVWFKKNGIKFWAVYLEKFGMPTALGKFPAGSTEEIIANTLAAAAAVGRDSAVAIPNDIELDLLAEGRASAGSYLEFTGEMNDALLRVILSQTGTSKSEAQGLGGSQSDVMKDVRDEVVRADSDMLHESFNRTVAKWLTEWNFGPDCPVPKVYRNLEDQEDINAIVDRDVKLKGLGWVRTEESAREIYGEGYERAPEPEPLDVPGAGAGSGNVVNIAAARAKRAAAREEFAAMDPSSLYVSRRLLPRSARALRAWAEAAGIPNLVPAEKMHVTIITSQAPVDWFELADDWGDSELQVKAGGPRKVGRLGEKGLVLFFGSARLRWRREEMIERGAVDKWDDYSPHVTVSYDIPTDFDLDGIEPFQGPLVFGPERFEPVNDDWVATLNSKEFSADDLDQIERFAASMASEADPILVDFAASLQGRLGGIKDVDALRVALLEGLEKFPTERLGELAGLPFVAVRAGAEADIERKVRF